MKPWVKIAGVMALACSSAFAINGYGVYTLWHDPFVAESPWNPPSYMGTGPNYGPIIGVTIANNTVVKRDTLFPGVGECPSLSFDGKRAAFFRWSVQLTRDNAGYHLVSGIQNGPHYISVIDIQTKTVTNIIQCDKPCGTVKDADAFLDWPAGDWIYYEKPTETRQFYRINVKDPSRNELLCTDAGDQIRRWNLSSDAKYCGMQSNNLGGACKFPFVNNSVAQSDPSGAAACNHCVSTMGNFFGHYFAGNHEWMCIERYDHIGPPGSCTVGSPTAPQPFDNWETHQISDLQKWGATNLTTAGGGAEVLKWSVNSEKWAMRMIGACGQAFDPNVENCVAVNWVDSQAINLSQIPPPPYCGADASKNPKPTHCADVGDLWVDFGPGNEHKWEDETGALHILPPIDPIGYSPAFTSINVTCANQTAVVGQKLQFTAEAWDQELQKISPQPAIAWSASGGGTISTTGLFTAGNTAGGPYTITAAATVGGVQQSGSARVVVKNKLAGLFYQIIPRTGDCTPDLTMYPFAHRGSASGTAAGLGLAGVPTRDNIGVRFSGLVDVPADGQYTFYVSADDGCILWIEGAKIATCHYTTGGSGSGSIALTAGLHPIALDWNQGFGGMDLSVQWECAAAGVAKQVIPNNRLFNAGQSATIYDARYVPSAMYGARTLSVSALGAGYLLKVNADGVHRIEVMTPAGRIIARFSGAGMKTYLIPGSVLSPGVCLVKSIWADRRQVEKIVVR
jgi:hypothetical protein